MGAGSSGLVFRREIREHHDHHSPARACPFLGVLLQSRLFSLPWPL
jgi:hypothetical protein